MDLSEEIIQGDQLYKVHMQIMIFTLAMVLKNKIFTARSNLLSADTMVYVKKKKMQNMMRVLLNA